MPSNLPVIRVRTNEDTVIKIKYVAKCDKKSLSKEIESLIFKRIEEFESEHGEIKIEQMNLSEIAQDIQDRLTKSPPYGDCILDDNTINELYNRYEIYQDEITKEEFEKIVSKYTKFKEGKVIINLDKVIKGVKDLFDRKCQSI